MRLVVSFGRFAVQQDLAMYFGQEKTRRRLGDVAKCTSPSDFALHEEQVVLSCEYIAKNVYDYFTVQHSLKPVFS